jgi:S-formylglutathione hydrolase FrmB
VRKLWILVAAALLWAPAIPPGRAEGGLTPVSDTALSGRLHELVLHSPALNADTGVRVLLPVGYDADTTTRYPVLFLLHGAGDDHTTWTTNTDLATLPGADGLIVVMPDGGRNADAGWYSNWVNGPQWETYHIDELIPWVNANYRTAAWGVAGLSMGGYGALEYASRHPDLFVVAGSFSGAVDNADGGPAEAAAYAQLNSRFGTPNSDVWGDYNATEITWRDHNPADLAGNLVGHVTPWLETGTGVPLPPGDSANDAPAEAAVHLENLAYMAKSGTAVHDRGYGVHSWTYFQAELHDFLPFALPLLTSPPAASPDFAYQSAESAFSVFGWTFSATRANKEFLKADVTPARLTLTGSGTVHVVSAPWFTPGVDYGIATADAAGRLAFDVVLGPSHQYDQYSPLSQTEQPEQATVAFTAT